MRKRLLAFASAMLMFASAGLAGCGSSASSGGSSGSTQAPAAQTGAAQAAQAEAVQPGTQTEAQAAGEAKETSAGPKTLLTACAQDIGSLQPWGHNYTIRFEIIDSIFEPLFWMNEDKELQPILAKSYENLGDGRFQVTLFDYIYDANGNQLKASDVVFSLDKFIEEGSNARNISSLKEYKAVDDYTVEFQFSNDRAGNFETVVTLLLCCTEASFNASPDQMVTTPVGTGRYELSEYVSGSYYTVKKRDSYWQTDDQYICLLNEAKVDEITARQIRDNSTIAVALENNEIDFTENITETDRSNFMNDDGTPRDGYTMKVVENPSLIRLYFNCSENSPCQDINLRKAIATAIDNAAIAQNAQGALGSVAYNNVNPIWLDADLTLNTREDGYYDYNEEKAKEYLAQSGYNGEPVRLLVFPNENTTDSAVLIQAYCKKVGINVELLTYEDALYKELRGEETGTVYDMDLGGITSSTAYTWKNFNELDVNAYKSGVNHNFIYDETCQDLYDKAASSATNSKEAANDLIKYVTDQCYIYSLFYYNNAYFAHSGKVQAIPVGPSQSFALVTAFDIN